MGSKKFGHDFHFQSGFKLDSQLNDLKICLLAFSVTNACQGGKDVSQNSICEVSALALVLKYTYETFFDSQASNSVMPTKDCSGSRWFQVRENILIIHECLEKFSLTSLC